MQLRNKTPKRRVKAKLREDRKEAIGPNGVWAMDFVHDQLATGQKIRILTVVDTFSRYVPVLDARFNYKGEDVVTTLDEVCRQIGCPKTIRVDNGSEFISRDMDPMGLPARCRPGLLTAREAHRQRVHRGLQWQVPGRVSKRPLVHGA